MGSTRSYSTLLLWSTLRVNHRATRRRWDESSTHWGTELRFRGIHPTPTWSLNTFCNSETPDISTNSTTNGSETTTQSAMMTQVNLFSCWQECQHYILSKMHYFTMQKQCSAAGVSGDVQSKTPQMNILRQNWILFILVDQLSFWLGPTFQKATSTSRQQYTAWELYYRHLQLACLLQSSFCS